MTKRESDGRELAVRAKQLLAQRRGTGRTARSALDVEHVLDELELHQIELEMQNEDLVRARADAESALALFAELYDLAPIGYFTLGHLGIIHKMNLLGAKLLGIDRASEGHRLGAFVATTCLGDFQAALSKALAGEAQTSCEVELAHRTPETGNPRYLQLTFSAAGPGAARAVGIDVTERRKLADELLTSQRMEAVARLAGGVAHDFNNLLTVILTGVETARMAADAGKGLHDELQLVTDAAQRAAGLTRKLLAFGRKQLLRPEVVDVNGLVRGLAPLVRTLLGERIELIMTLASDLGAIEVDPVQLEQVIVNLVVNAHDAMPDGGRFTITTAEVGSHLVITVADTGVGMDQELIGRIFEPFFTTKTRNQGTGLGLASVAGIVEQSGGTISVRSEPRKGATFEIHLPRRSGLSNASAPPKTTGTARGGSETILVVDDERALRRIAERILVAAGYTVLVAESGAEALEMARRHTGTIHLLLSDVMMPGMTGPELAGRLAAASPGIRVLFMSGYADDALGRAGVVDQDLQLLSKPYSADSLRTKVRDALDAPRSG